MADNEAAGRYSQRLADQITTLFYEACKLGSLETANRLAEALECEVLRSTRLVDGDGRQDGDDLVAVRARLRREVRRQLLNPVKDNTAASNSNP